MPARINITAALQLQGLDQFSRDLKKSVEGVNAKVNFDTGSAQSNLTKFNAGVGSATRALQDVRAKAVAANATLGATAKVTLDAGNAFENFASQAGLAGRRFLAFSVAAGGFLRVVQGVKEGIKAAVAFDLAMNKVAQVSGETSDRIGDIRKEINRLSTSLGVSSAELADVAVSLKQAGLSARDTKTALEAVALTSLAPNFDSMKQTTEGLIAVFRQFNLGADQFKNVLGSMNQVAGDFAVEASDLITAVQKAGGSFAAVAGQTKPGIEALAEFQGLFTSVRATTRESADTIATGLRTIFTRFQRADTVQALREFGVNLRYTRQEAEQLGDSSLENQFVGAYEAVKRLSEGLQGLRETDPRFSGIVEQLGGYRQISKVIPLLQQQGEAQKAYNAALAGQISLQAAAEKRQETLANKVDVLKERYLELGRRLVDSKGFQSLADSLIKVAGGFAQVVEFASPLIPILSALAAAKVAANLGSITGGFGRSFAAPVGSTIKRARGGWVPGVGDSDTVPALLTPGEFVVRKQAAEMIGGATLNRLNNVGRYAEGGFVQRFGKGGPVDDLSLNPSQLKLLEDALQANVVERVLARLSSGRGGKYFGRLGDEGESAGNEALIRAAQQYDPDHQSKTSFKTFASTYVEQAIRNVSKKFFGKEGRKAGLYSKLPLPTDGSSFESNIPGREAEPAQGLIDRQERARATAALGGAFPANYRDMQAAAKAAGIRATGSEDELAERLGNTIAARMAKLNQEYVAPPPAVLAQMAAIAEQYAQAPREQVGRANEGFSLNKSGVYQLAERDVAKFAQGVGLNAQQFLALAREIEGLAQEAGRLGEYMRGGSKAVVRFSQGALPQVVGFAGGQTVSGPGAGLNASDPAAVRYQEQVLAAAKVGKGEAFVDPLILARDSRPSRLGRAKTNEENALGAQSYSDAARKAADAQEARERLQAARYERRTEGVGGVTDPLQVKANALDAIRKGADAAGVLASVRGSLSPSQYRQLQLQVPRDFTARTAFTPVGATAGLSGRLQEALEGTRLGRPVLAGTALSRGVDSVLAGLGRIPGGFRSTAGGIAGASRGALSGITGGFGRANAFVENSRFGRFANSNAAAGLAFAAPLLADQVQKFGGDATAAVAGNKTGSYSAYRAAGGALSGVGLGAVTGAAVGGPLGAAVGGVVGGLTGLVTALNDAENDIRQVKINNALTTFQDRIGVLASLGVAGVDASLPSDLKKSLADYRAQADVKAREDATSTFGGFDPKAFSELQRKGLRNDFGGQLAQISAVLQREAERLGKANVGKSVDELAAKVRAGGDGLNDELLSIVASLRNVPVAQVDRELRKFVQGGQRAGRQETIQNAGRKAEERNVNTFNRLLLAVQSSSDALLSLQQRSESLASFYEGTVSSLRVSLRGGNLDQLGRGDRGALIPLNAIAGATGQAGGRLRDAGRVADDLERVLPGVIAAAAANGPKDQDDVATDVGRQLRGLLGRGEAAERAIAVVTRRLEEESATDKGGPANLFKQVETDASGFTQKILQGLVDPVKEVGQKVAQQLEDNANRLVDGLTTTANRVRQVGELYDQLGSLRGQRFRTELQFAAGRAGRGNQALDFARLKDLDRPFNDRQFRLAGAIGNDPAALGKALAATQKALEEAVQRQQAAAQATGGLRDGRFAAAAQEVVRLQSSAANLQQALRNLADVSTRTANAQEKLGRIEQERTGRLGLAERFATADGGERARLNRGFLLANAANNRGKLDGFSTDDRRLIVETLRAAGGVTLTGFKGSPRADDLADKLLSNSFGGAFKLTGGQQAEEAKLQKIVVEMSKAGEKAVGELAKTQLAATDNFFGKLGQQQNEFFSRLEAALVQDKVADKRNQAGEVSGKLGRLNGLAGQRDVLAAAGVTTTDQVKALQERRASLTAAQDLSRSRDDQAATLQGAEKRLRVGEFDGEFKRQRDSIAAGGGVDRADFLATLGRAGVDSVRAEASYKSFISRPVRDFGLDATEADRAKAFREDVALSVAEARRKGGDDFNAKITEKLGGLAGIKGVDSGKLLDTLAGKGGADFLKALETFAGGGAKLEGLNQEIENTRKQFEQLNREIAGMAGKQGGQGGVVRKAAGGRIGSHPGSPMGTDTVPAWLTPGEFVVNAAAAQAHLPLLTSLNSGAGYFAGGGRVRLEDEAKFLSKAERFGETAQRGGFNAAYARAAKSGLSAKGLQRFAESRAGRRAGRFEAYALARSAAMENGFSRPGDEGQKAVASRIYGLQADSARSLYRNDAYYQRFLARATAGAEVGRPRRLSRGGPVRYMAGGGPVSGGGDNGLASSMAGFSQSAQLLSQSFSSFAGSATALASAIEQMPRTLAVSGQHQVVVTLNGAEVLGKISPEIRTLVADQVRSSLSKVFKEQMPDAGVVVG